MDIQTVSSDSILKIAEETARDIAEKKYASLRRGLAVFGIAFFAVGVAIVTASVFYIANLADTISQLAEVAQSSETVVASIERNNLLSSDYMAVVIPMLIALAGAFITFLGMERLKSFDERIDETRKDIRDEFDDFRKQIDQSETDMREGLRQFDKTIAENQRTAEAEIAKKITDGIDAEKKNHLKALDDRSSDLLDQFEQESKKKQDELATNVGEQQEDLKELERKLDEKFGWLKGIISEGNIDPSVPTVFDAHRLVERLRAEKKGDYIQAIHQIAEYVCKADNLSGDYADYHNLAAEFARGSMYLEACEILEKGITYFPKNVDLLSDMVEYATKASMFRKAEQAVSSLSDENNIPRRSWNWRCYEFICDYYRARGKFDEAYQICKEFIEAIPDDEHGYGSKAEIERILQPGMEGILTSITTLEDALKEGINCPQCANALTETYLSIGEYEKALDTANRTIQELAQQQPHVNIAYVYLNRANAQDRMFLSLTADEKEKQAQVAERAYADYAMALTLPRLSFLVKQQAETRMKVLKPYLSQEFLEQANNESESNDDGINLSDFIQALRSNNNDDLNIQSPSSSAD